MSIKFSYHPDVDTAYISFGEYVRSNLTLERKCLIDVDDQGYIVGIEFLDFADPTEIIAGVRE